jgi:hypothetical protein
MLRQVLGMVVVVSVLGSGVAQAGVAGKAFDCTVTLLESGDTFKCDVGFNNDRLKTCDIAPKDEKNAIGVWKETPILPFRILTKFKVTGFAPDTYITTFSGYCYDPQSIPFLGKNYAHDEVYIWGTGVTTDGGLFEYTGPQKP